MIVLNVFIKETIYIYIYIYICIDIYIYIYIYIHIYIYKHLVVGTESNYCFKKGVRSNKKYYNKILNKGPFCFGQRIVSDN